MRNSLFIKIYLTLLVSLTFVAIATAVFLHRGQHQEDLGWGGRRDRLIAAMLPADADEASTQAMLDRLAIAFDADLALYAPDGTLIAEAGDPLPRRRLERRRAGREPRPFAFPLPDGRVLAARTDMRLGPRGRNPLAFIALIAGTVGLAAYPVVRHLTSRLETLQRGVESWGDGALHLRVPVAGSDEIAAVARSFNTAAARIERLVASHRSLLANASHELRSPLARLRMAVDLYEASGNEKTKAEIVENLSELDALVEEILLASRLDHVDAVDRSETVDLLALTAEEGARQDVAVSGAPALLKGDPRLLTRLVRNLMQNGLRHGAPPVTAEVTADSGVVRVSVRDQGEGIPEQDRASIFEPFYRPAGKSESAGGWGLGLALVQQIARHHGGTVRYETPASGGACFVAEFPANTAAPPS